LGFTVPDKYLEKMQVMETYNPTQTHKLSWAIVKGLESEGKNIVDLISSFPASTYPSNRKILFGLIMWKRTRGGDGVIIPYINIFLLKHFTRFFSATVFLLLWHIKNRRDKRTVLVYGLNSSHIYAAIFTSALFKVKNICIVTDPPGRSMPNENWIISTARIFDRKILVTACSYMAGMISLTKALIEKLEFTGPSIIVEGIIVERDINLISDLKKRSEDQKLSEDFIIMYAGGLSVEYGIKVLLDATKYILTKNYQLWLCGWGSMVDEINNKAANNGRIKFYGNLGQRELRKLLLSSTILINPRPSKENFTELSFPSKTLEYMASGKPVVSTKLAGIPEGYFQHLVCIEDETPKGIAYVINSLQKKNRKELNEIGAGAKCYVEKFKNEKYQGRRISHFINEIVNEASS